MSLIISLLYHDFCELNLQIKGMASLRRSQVKGHREERLAALLVLRQLAAGPLAGTIVEGVQPLLGIRHDASFFGSRVSKKGLETGTHHDIS